MRAPSFHPWVCINGTCNQCGIDVKHKMSECDILMQNEQLIDLLEWQDIPGQGFKQDGKPNTQLELSRTKLSVKDVMVKMMAQLELY